MLLPREKKILNLLLKKEKTFTASEIATELKVSPRTIKADIKRMNGELEKNSCSICTKRGVGYWLDYDHEGEAYLKTILTKTNTSYMGADVRKYYIAAELLDSKEYTSMETIANDLYVSKATVNNDIKELEPFWERFELECIKRAKYGVMVTGSEKKIRQALFEIMKNITKYSEGTVVETVQDLFEDVDLAKLQEVIRKTEVRFNFVLADVSLDEFLIKVAVILQRILKGNIQEETEQKDERKERFVAIYLREVIEDIMEIQVPDSELASLTRSLRGLRYQVPLIKETEKSALEKREPEMFGYMMEVLREIDAKYLLELEDDEEFLCSLFPHLECMIHRMKSEMYFENPILESVKREMFYEYEIASYLVSKFNTKYGIEATEDEIGYITFHIGTSIERTAGNKAKKTVVTLVCMSGVGSSQFMAVKLQRVLPDLKIKRIISSNQTGDLKKEDQDLVISTVPLTLEGIDVVQVSLVLNEGDIQKIQNYVESRRSVKEEKSDYSYLKRFLWEDISILQCDLNSREEVIEVLGKRMIREGYVDEGYVESVFEREKLSDTCVGSLVAIPHAFQGHIRKPGIGLLTLRKPIPWGKENAQIVFMLSLDANVGADFQKIFKAVFNLTKNYKDVEKILKAESLTKLKREIL